LHVALPICAKHVTEFRGILDNAPNTLFVVPAPNYGIPVYDSSNASDPRYVTLYAGVLQPNGSQFLNLVGVTGTSYCNQHQFRLPSNAAGTWFYKLPNTPAVVAPSEVVPVVLKSGARDYASGNSFAVPIVSSLAAIIKWLRPAKTAADIKGNLFEYGNRAGPKDAADNYYPPVNFAQQIIRQLIAFAQEAGFINEITPIVARWLGPTHPDPIGAVMTQVCGEKFEFVQHANIPETPPPGDPPTIFYDDRQRNYAALVNPYIDISSSGTSTTWLIKVRPATGNYVIEIGCPGCGFMLDTWYPISQGSAANLVYGKDVGAPTSYPFWSARPSAFSTGGIKFTQCQITQNSWGDGTSLREPPHQQSTFLYNKGYSPWYAIVKGVMENLLTEVTYIKDDQPETTPKIDPSARVEKKEFTLQAMIDCEADPVLCHDLNYMCYGGSFNFPSDYP
ncbi:MAG: S8/S53 family peptidase, partial [Polyangia bacterium]|nr:S8/S53 family peptidase [Polyangia bacterium]